MTDVEVHEKEVGGLPITRPEDLPDEYRDMAMTPEEAVKRRNALLRFVADVLEEATYKPGGTPERINDYYRVPGSAGLALSKRGAEKLADLYRFKVLRSETVEHKSEQDYCYARARVTLHRMGGVVAEREASASSAERSFQAAAKKYGGDFRAADNDIVAKAQKRAYVQAVISALSATEILAAADDYEHIPQGDAEPVPAQSVTSDLLLRAFKLSTKALGVGVITDDEAEKFQKWAERPGREPAQLEAQIAALEDRLVQAEEERGPIK